MKWLIKVLDFITMAVLPLVLSIALSGKFDNKFDFLKNYPDSSILTLVVIQLILYGIYKYLKQNENKKINELENSLNEAKNKNIFYEDLISTFKRQISFDLENELYKIFGSLKLNHQHRITVYSYTAGVFFSIGRYSKNESLSKFGRIAISDKREMLFQIWNNGQEDIKKMQPAKERNMQTRKIAIFFLYAKNENDALAKKDKFGVIVFESINKNDKVLHKENMTKLQEATESINEYFYKSWAIKQDLSIAVKEDL